ncbi:MAG TPA: hypothetical protein VFY14_08785, partial [Streptomyces sp.]|nr:hypothetical protein [Streptomyces sp.]
LAAVRTAGGALSPGSPGDGELPGEAAALAAFRAARLRAPDDGVGAAPGRRPPQTEPAAAPPLVRVLGRPLRAGTAAVALGGVLCGVAVAAGTGALPVPFGRGSGPLSPPSSVSSAVPEDGGSPLPPPGTPYGVPQGDGGRDGAARSGGPRAPDAPDGGGSGDRTADGPASAAGTTGRGGTGGSAGPGGSRTGTGTAVLCELHAAGLLSGAERARLERAAGGPDEVDGYCRGYGGPEGGAGSPEGVSADGGGDPGWPGSPGSPGSCGGAGNALTTGGKGALDGTGDTGGEAGGGGEGLPGGDRPNHGPASGTDTVSGSTSVAGSGPSVPPDALW